MSWIGIVWVVNWDSLSWEFYNLASFSLVEKYFQSNLTWPMHNSFFFFFLIYMKRNYNLQHTTPPKGSNNLWGLECGLQTNTRTLLLKFDCWFIYVYFEVQIKFKLIIKLNYTFNFDLFFYLTSLYLFTSYLVYFIVQQDFSCSQAIWFSFHIYVNIMTKFSFSINLVT